MISPTGKRVISFGMIRYFLLLVVIDKDAPISNVVDDSKPLRFVNFKYIFFPH